MERHRSSRTTTTNLDTGEVRSFQTDTYSKVPGVTFVPGILRLVFICMFSILLIQVLNDSSSSITFSNFLSMLQGSAEHIVSTDWIYNGLPTIDTTSWGDWSWVAKFCNACMSIVRLLLLLCTGVVQLITYLFYFLGFIFS